MKNETQARKPRRFRNAAPLVLSALALFAATTGAASALPGTSTVNSGDVKDETLKSQDLKDGKAVAGSDVVDSSITRDDLAPSSVRTEELGDGIHAHNNSVVVPGSVAQNANYVTREVTASCGGGEELISGSANWTNNNGGEEVMISEATLDHNAEAVTVTGGTDIAQDRTLVAVAHCL